MVGRRWLLLGAFALLGACGQGSEPDAGEEGAGRSASVRGGGDAWDVGQDAGMQYGPFPDVFDVWPTPSQPTEVSDWLSVVFPAGDPLEGFYAVVDDAVGRGFTVTVRDGGACWQEWQREEVPFGENGEGDGESFQGTAPLGDTLPVGAGAVGVDCRAVAARRDTDTIDIWMRASLRNDAVLRPGEAAVVIRTRREAAPTHEFTRQDLDVDLFAATDEAEKDRFYLEARKDHPWGDLGGCLATVRRSSKPPVEAVSDAVASGEYATYFEGSPTEVSVAQRTAAVQSQMIPAGGPVVYVLGAETDAGTDVLVCMNSSP